MIFKCPNDCDGGLQTQVDKVQIRYKDGKTIYKDMKIREDVTCPKCNEPKIDVTPFGGYGAFRKIHSMPREKKQAFLKARADKHSKMLRKKGRAM